MVLPLVPQILILHASSRCSTKSTGQTASPWKWTCLTSCCWWHISLPFNVYDFDPVIEVCRKDKQDRGLLNEGKTGGNVGILRMTQWVMMFMLGLTTFPLM